MKLETKATILPVATYDETKDSYKNILIFVNIPELPKSEMKKLGDRQLSKIKMTLEYQESILDDVERNI